MRQIFDVARAEGHARPRSTLRYGERKQERSVALASLSLGSGPDRPLLGLFKSISGTLGYGMANMRLISRDAKPKAEPSTAERNASRPTGR
jgi:hypothetical protein